MNKKIFCSYLLSASICSFSLQATKEEFLIENVVNLDSVEEILKGPRELPLLAECLVDENGTITKITNVKHLDKNEITKLCGVLNQENIQVNNMSLDNALTLVVSGSFDVAKGIGIVLFIGGQYIVPRVITFTHEAWSSLSEKYKEYKVRERIVNFTEEAWASLVEVYTDYINQVSEEVYAEEKLETPVD